MRTATKVLGAAGVGVAALLGAVALHAPNHIGPAYLYPTSHLTPGVVATDSFADLTAVIGGQTYSMAHRNTSDALKKEVRAEYPQCPAQQEIDHFVPLALGGADVLGNLWCQPAINQWNGKDYGYHTKDKLESYLIIMVKAGTLAPNVAQTCILSDWVACYQKYLGAQKFGALYYGEDSDDDTTGTN